MLRVPQEIKFHSGIEFADSGVSPKMLQVLGTWQTHESQTISWPLWDFDPRSSPGHLRPSQTISDHLRQSPGPGPASSAGMRSRTGAQSRSGDGARARGVALEQPARDAVGVERVSARERNDEVLSSRSAKHYLRGHSWPPLVDLNSWPARNARGWSAIASPAAWLSGVASSNRPP